MTWLILLIKHPAKLFSPIIIHVKYFLVEKILYEAVMIVIKPIF